MESAMLHCHVSTISQNGQIKYWLYFMLSFFASFVASRGSSLPLFHIWFDLTHQLSIVGDLQFHYSSATCLEVWLLTDFRHRSLSGMTLHSSGHYKREIQTVMTWCDLVMSWLQSAASLLYTTKSHVLVLWSLLMRKKYDRELKTDGSSVTKMNVLCVYDVLTPLLNVAPLTCFTVFGFVVSANGPL